MRRSGGEWRDSLRCGVIFRSPPVTGRQEGGEYLGEVVNKKREGGNGCARRRFWSF